MGEAHGSAPKEETAALRLIVKSVISQIQAEHLAEQRATLFA
jgi:hypothetical protein